MPTIKTHPISSLDLRSGGTLIRFDVIDDETRVTNTLFLTKAQAERLMYDIREALNHPPISWKELALHPTGNPPVIRNPHNDSHQPLCTKQLAQRFLTNARIKAKDRPK